MSKHYSWLIKYEKAWLMENLPKPVKVKCNKPISRINWEERDKQLCFILKEEYEKLLSYSKPVRITRALLGRKANCDSSLKKDLDKLPETSLLLNKICEDMETFHTRKIRLMVQELDSEIRLWEVFWRAGVSKKYQDKIRDIISKDPELHKIIL